MRLNRRFVPLNLDEDITGHPIMLFSLSEEAQAFVSEIVDDQALYRPGAVRATASEFAWTAGFG
ncbi:hypothetical protein [Microbulbifer sp. GL-2]|uniref:hypothetical protein n=1 Tax=Microbulbifer sp. GL-2 TaxID=2591606 RepID=UPI00116531C4|nr:hypothetical protein [Microbulbifer sp. GL-2]BBM03693.1 hypothetical protein GL2_37670 [Microbulbifer sp. GL-2]